MRHRRPEWLAPPRRVPDEGERAGLLRTLSKRLLHLVPAAAAIVAVLVAIMLSLPGCPPPRPTDQPPAKLEGIPEIRVLVHTARKAALSTTGAYRMLADGALVASGGQALTEADLSRAGRHWYLGAGSIFVADTLVVEAVGESFVGVDGRRYRGRIALHGDGPDGFRCINHLDVESYLAGVLRRELFGHWDIKTYQAQAIAARTYALYEKNSTGRKRDYDVSDDQSSQVYGGADAETDKSRLAVRSTRGIILATGPDGDERIFRAHYSSCCGGKTNNRAVLYGRPVTTGPLVGGQVCRDCSASEQHRWSAVSFRKRTLHRSLARRHPKIAAMPGIKDIRLKTEIHGRAIRAEVIGTRGRKVTIRTEDLRLALLRDGKGKGKGLYSMNCPVRVVGNSVIFGPGRGFGHGVGMCQWGAQGMARRGCTLEEILTHYYPGAKLFKAYH